MVHKIIVHNFTQLYTTFCACTQMPIVIFLGQSVYSLYRRLRQKHPQQILINLCFALLGLYLVFVIGIDQPSWGNGCVTVAVLIHFFCMASIVWMGVEAFSMYLMFVKVMNTYTPNLLLKSCLVGWGEFSFIFCWFIQFLHLLG